MPATYYRQTITVDLSLLPLLLAIKVQLPQSSSSPPSQPSSPPSPFVLGCLLAWYPGEGLRWLSPSRPSLHIFSTKVQSSWSWSSSSLQYWYSNADDLLLRKQHISSNTKSHSIDYNLLPRVSLIRKPSFVQVLTPDVQTEFNCIFQEPELCPECPELPYSTDTKFWSQNPYVEQQQQPYEEKPYTEQNYGQPVLSSYGAGLGGADNDLIEIPPNPFSHQPYSRRRDPPHIGSRRNEGSQVLF